MLEIKLFRKLKRNKDIEKEVLSAVYIHEIKKAREVLETEFIKVDLKKEGLITIYQLKKILNKTNLVTPKEVNAIIRNIKSDPYEYKNFQDDLYNVRYELAKSRILENSLDFIQKTFINHFIDKNIILKMEKQDMKYQAHSKQNFK